MVAHEAEADPDAGEAMDGTKRERGRWKSLWMIGGRPEGTITTRVAYFLIGAAYMFMT